MTRNEIQKISDFPSLGLCDRFAKVDIRKLVGLGCADLAAHEVDGDGPREEEVG